MGGREKLEAVEAGGREAVRCRGAEPVVEQVGRGDLLEVYGALDERGEMLCAVIVESPPSKLSMILLYFKPAHLHRIAARCE